MMARPVVFSTEAAQDLDELYGYLAQHDSPASAERVLARIVRTVASLAKSPGRGAVPPELAALGLRAYREVFFKPYRIVYRALPRRVVVVLVADGRRDLQTLLQRRLLQA
jgi:toxin ParE1/3/4